MIVWGTGGDNVHVGSLNEQPCDTCGETRPFSVLLNYRYFGFYWVFNCVTERKYYALCEVCRSGVQLDQKEIVSTLPPAPIPFMRRYGLIVLGAIVAVIMVAGVLNER